MSDIFWYYKVYHQNGRWQINKENISGSTQQQEMIYIQGVDQSLYATIKCPEVPEEI